MKVLDLQCANKHVFEGWFSSEADFQDQQGMGQVECPVCGNATVVKMISAPRLNFGSEREAVQAISLQKKHEGFITARPKNVAFVARPPVPKLSP